MEIDVLIIFEHVNRELESALLLEKKLKDRGFSTKVVQIGWNEGPARLYIRPKIIITPCCYDDKDLDTICAYKGAYKGGKIKVINLHCEQITNNDAIEFVLPSGNSKKTFHLAWGQYFKDELIKIGIPEDLICVTGSPRLDLFREEFRNICLNKEQLGNEFHLDSTKKWILLIGNFSAAFFTDAKLTELEKRSVSNARLNTNISRQSYDSIMSWYDQVCSHFESNHNVEFIYRPHPSEPISVKVQNLANTYPNFHIIKEFAIRDWIVNSDVAFMWNSTSSVEVAFGNIPVFSLRPTEIPEVLKFSLLEHVQQITSPQEFILKIKETIAEQKTRVNELFWPYIGYYYHRGTKPAVDITVDLIEQIIDEDDNFLQGKKYLPLSGIVKWFKYILKQVLYKLGLLKRMQLIYKILSDDHISKERLQKYRDKYNALK